MEGYFKIFFCNCSFCISPSEVCLEMWAYIQLSIQGPELFLCELLTCDTVALFTSGVRWMGSCFVSPQFSTHACKLPSSISLWCFVSRCLFDSLTSVWWPQMWSSLCVRAACADVETRFSAPGERYFWADYNRMELGRYSWQNYRCAVVLISVFS